MPNLMGAILSPIADPILQHIAADRAEAQTALAARRGFGFPMSLARRLPIADQRKYPSPAEQQQDGKTIDKGPDRDQQYQRGLVAERVYLRELDRRKFGRNPERRGEHGAANHELGQRSHQR